jgi:hypothetical protein
MRQARRWLRRRYLSRPGSVVAIASAASSPAELSASSRSPDAVEHGLLADEVGGEQSADGLLNAR